MLEEFDDVFYGQKPADLARTRIGLNIVRQLQGDDIADGS